MFNLRNGQNTGNRLEVTEFSYKKDFSQLPHSYGNEKSRAWDRLTD